MSSERSSRDRGRTIRRITSDLPSFKALDFHPGFNLIVAEKDPEASDRQTRNGAGKTSLVELIHFLLGGKCDHRSIFRTKPLVDYSFSMEIMIAGTEVRVTRSGSSEKRVLIEGDISEWESEALPRLFGGSTISNDAWSEALLSVMFGMPPSAVKMPDRPSFRLLFPYFARRQNEGFLSPEKHHARQSIGDQQIAVTYLLGLDWTIPAELKRVRERERMLKELRDAVRKGVLGKEIGNAASLRTQLTIAEESARKLKDQLAEFRVHEEYHDLEAEASKLTRELADLADQNTLDRQYLEELEEATRGEKPPDMPDLERLYGEAGIVLPDAAIRRFEDVRKFHDSVVRNRKSYLSREIETARHHIEERNSRKSKIDERRAEIIGVLSSHGALEQLRELQLELTRREAETESIRQRFDAALALEGKKSELKIERARIHNRLRQDHQEQGETLREAILAFEAVSNMLYEKAGSLTIDDTERGPYFDIRIHGERSAGISHMQIFCFDMMLMQLCIHHGIGPRFLVHDSHLFDGVDERQVGKALQIGASLARDLDFQYLATMNTDSIPEDLPTDFSLDRYILPVQLTDMEGGGLFGVSF